MPQNIIKFETAIKETVDEGQSVEEGQNPLVKHAGLINDLKALGLDKKNKKAFTALALDIFKFDPNAQRMIKMMMKFVPNMLISKIIDMYIAAIFNRSMSNFANIKEFE